MKIAILTSGVLPVPAVQGGAVENLIDFYLEYNELHKLHDITIYSVWNPSVKNHPALKSEANRYYYINTNNLIAKIEKRVLHYLHHKEEYYHYTIEYYLHETLKHICKQHYDVVILENRPGYSLKLHKKLNIPLIYHLGNDFLNDSTKQHMEIYQASQLIITASQYITERVGTIRKDTQKCVTVHNAIDIKKFMSAQPINRELIHLKEENFVIVYSGRLVKEKGILQLLQAFKQVETQIPQSRLLIIGANAYGSNQRNTPFIRQLEAEINSIRHKVIFTGFINYDQVPSYLKVADIGIVPSIWEEPFGLTVVESMAAGVPLITTRSGGIPEICEGVATIIDNDSNTIVSSLSNAIIDLYQHSEKRKLMSEAALKRSQQFCKERFAYEFFKALENLL